jgi:hypothetical protein
LGNVGGALGTSSRGWSASLGEGKRGIATTLAAIAFFGIFVVRQQSLGTLFLEAWRSLKQLAPMNRAIEVRL